MVRALQVLLAVGLVGCAPDREAFPSAAAKAICDRFDRCDANFLENLYDGDIQRCRDWYESTVEDIMDVNDALPNCEYQPSEAAEYLRESSSADCGNEGAAAIGAELADVYVCGD